jgi:hypothetical protein
MLTSIGPNKYQLIGKLIILIVSVALLLLFVNVMIYPPVNNTQSVWLLPACIAIFLLLIVIIFIQLLFLPTSFAINDSEIIIKYLLLRSKYLQLEDIDSYATTLIFTRNSEYKGVLVHLMNGKRILLSDFNLKDYSSILTFLETSNVKFNGQEKFKFISYYTQGA